MRLHVPVLTGGAVQLEPLADSHREPLRAAADDERIWQHTLVNGRGEGFGSWFDTAHAELSAGTRVPFAVRRLKDGMLIGSTSYLDVNLKHRRLEIGSTWYHPSAWGTAVNPECKLLLLAHAFDVIGVNRVALITDAMNARSRSTIERLGAVREGVLRAHMLTQGDRVRDSVVYSIMAGEWPTVRERLRSRLAV